MPIDQDILKELRKDKGLTQEDIGKLLGLTGAGYANYETGRRIMRADLLEKIATILGVSVDYILGRTWDSEVRHPRNLDTSDK